MNTRGERPRGGRVRGHPGGVSWWHWLGPAGGEPQAGTAEISISLSSREARGQLGLGCFKIHLEREWQVGWGPQEPTAAAPVPDGTSPGHLHIPTPAWEARAYVGSRDLTVPLLRAAGPRAPHCRLLLVSSPGSATPFRQKGEKKRKEKENLSAFLTQPLLPKAPGWCRPVSVGTQPPPSAAYSPVCP